MLLKTKKGFYVLKRFSQISRLFHGFSTVDFGNMSFAHGEKKEVLKNRDRFVRTAGINPKRIISSHQEQGNKILIVEIDNSINQTEKIIADGLLTAQNNIGLFIKTADCLSILLFDSKKEAIGLIHAGEKGVSLGIHLEAILKMKENFGCQPGDLLVGLGPAICARCYHGKIDLIGSVMTDFQKVGIKRKNIEIAGVCTFESKDFYSHQRSKITGEPEGRFATLLSWS